MNFPPDWDVERTSEEWKELARDLAKEVGYLNHRMWVDPSYIHWLAQNLNDGKLFRIDEKKGEYVRWLDAR